MSSGQRPRTPEHFPRMKVRGHRRRARRILLSGELDDVIQQTVDYLNDMLFSGLGLPIINFGALFTGEQRRDMVTAYRRNHTTRKEERSNAT
ncbi:hypothetical protein [Rhodococcoides fascians]|uniref:hypothetical protein n=1 Tax=Rhodococcoides fascians TaxID=1828 RepID=UPI00055A1066|nr:hypothetical protein [Rhodococcus fascians]